MKYKSPIIIGFLGVLLLVLPKAIPAYYLGLGTLVIIFALFAMSLDLLVGVLGLSSLGHAAFFGMGAYAAGLVSLNVSSNFWLCLTAGLLSGLGLGALFGLLAVRASGSGFLMITLALGQVMWGIAYKWRSLTGGDDGLVGIGMPDLCLPIGRPLVLDQVGYYYLVLVVCGLMGLLLAIIMKSPVGLTLRGIKDSESRIAALGYNVFGYKYLCFILAGGFAAIAGVLYVFYNRFVGPSDLGVILSGQVLLMVILGGAGTLWGAAVGALIIVLLENIISAFTERWVLVLGIVYVLVIMFFPEGIVKSIKNT